MGQNPLRRQLEQLHGELTSVAADQPDEHLAGLQAETQALIERVDRITADEHQSLRERLSEALPQFEASHPRLTAAMAEVLDTLNRMGL